jgi:hypothetical protein
MLSLLRCDASYYLRASGGGGHMTAPLFKWVVGEPERSALEPRHVHLICILNDMTPPLHLICATTMIQKKSQRKGKAEQGGPR